MMDTDDPDTLARERRLDALLAEAAGAGLPEDLAARVLDRVRPLAPAASIAGSTRRPRPAARPAARLAARLAAALLVACGIAAVVGARVLGRADGASALPSAGGAPGEEQDGPSSGSVVVLTNATVTQHAGLSVSEPGHGNAGDQLYIQCLIRKAPLVMPSGLRGAFRGGIHEATLREAVDRMAECCGAGIVEVGRMMVVQPGIRGLPYARGFTLRAERVDVRSFARALASRLGIGIVVAPGVRGKLSCDLVDASWRDALDLAADRLGLEVFGCGTVLLVRERRQSIRTIPFYEGKGARTAWVAAVLAQQGRFDVVGAANLQGDVDVIGGDVETDLLRAVVRTAGRECRTDEANRHVVSPAARTPMAVDVLAEDADFRTVAELLRSASGVDVALPDGRGARLSVYARRAPFADLQQAVLLASEEIARSRQDPEQHAVPVVEVTDASVRARVGEPVSIAAGTAAIDALLRLAGERRVPVAARAGLSGALAEAIEGASVHAAIGRLAAAAGAIVEEVDGVFVVRREGAGLPLAATFSSSATTDVRGFVRALSASTGARIVLADDVRGRVACDLHDAPWRAVLEHVAAQLGAEVTGCGSVLLVRRRTAPTRTPNVVVTFDGMALTRVVDVLAKMGQLNVVVAPQLDTEVSLRIRRIDAEHVLRAAARAAEAELLVEDRGILRLVPASPEPVRPIDVLAEDVELRTIAELLRSASGVDVAVPEGAGPRFSVFARAARLEDLARALALATRHEVARQPDGSLRIE